MKCSSDSCRAAQLRKEGVGPEQGSPAARVEMLHILGEPLSQLAGTLSFFANCSCDSCRAAQLRKEGVAPEKSSPEARAEMLNILEEPGLD